MPRLVDKAYTMAASRLLHNTNKKLFALLLLGNSK